MPQIDWTPEFKRNTTPDFDRLKLKVGESARVVCMDKPTFAWTHTLRAPMIVEGQGKKEIKKRKDGTEYADWVYEFVSRPQCLGDYATIEEEGSDPANCPVCARAKDSEECGVPERRFAVNLIRYNTKSDGTVISPFGCSSQVWAFTENNFNKLLGISNEHGGLVGKDLILGPCQPPENFQRFDMSAGAKNVWEMDENVRKTVLDTHENNKMDDLESACGRKTEAKWLKRDIATIAEKWRIANGTVQGAPASEKADVQTLKGELDNLLAPPPTAKQEEQHTQLRADRPADSDKRESTGGSEPDDFSKLLANLNI